MSNVSIPLPGGTLAAIEKWVQSGVASSRADLVRRAVEKYLEDLAVEAILRARKEPRLEGDIDELASKL